jgi:CBS domain containing-hemolysin-like protein
MHVGSGRPVTGLDGYWLERTRLHGRSVVAEAARRQPALTTIDTEGPAVRSRLSLPEVPINTALGLVAMAALIAANGLFVAAEFALVAVDRNRMEREAESGDRRARRVDTLVRRLSFHLSGAQLGITVTSLVLGFLSAPVVAALLEPLLAPVLGGSAVVGISVGLALVLATLTQMVLGELVPKSLAIANPDRVAKVLSRPVATYGVVLGPVIRLLDGAANATVRRLGVEPVEELARVRSLAEFEVLFRSAAEGGVLGDSAAELLHRSLRLAGRTAADVLVPRPRVEALPVDASVADLVARARRTGHSRFVVHGGDLDDLRGVVHVKAAHTVPRADRSSTPVMAVMGEILAVPESRELDDLLADMRDSRHHLVAVVDEHGGTAGIVTLEDVIEQVVGDIIDEHDPRAPMMTRSVRPGEWSVEGSMHPDEVAELTGLHLPEGPFETLAGFVLERMGRIPDQGDRFTHEDWQLTVEALDRRRVARVHIVAPRPASLDGEPSAGGAP